MTPDLIPHDDYERDLAMLESAIVEHFPLGCVQVVTEKGAAARDMLEVAIRESETARRELEELTAKPYYSRITDR